MPKKAQSQSTASAPTTDEAWRIEVALFRYTLALPLIQHDPKRDGSKKALRNNIAAMEYDIPHSRRRKVSVFTLRRWEKAFLKGGFEALKPKPRSDKGSCRALSIETLDRAETLKREQPLRSARSIIRILFLDTCAGYLTHPCGFYVQTSE